MDCAEARGKLLDAVGGELAQPGRGALEKHLAACLSCAAELRRLTAADAAVRQAVAAMAPQGGHLTPERLEWLMADYADRSRPIRLGAHRGLVAAAAVVTILVSGAVIALSLPGLFGTPEPSADVAAAGRLPGVIPVVFTSMGQEEPMRVMRSLTVQGADLSGRAGPDRAVRLVETSSPGVLVPVDHAFYDPEESSRWW